MSVQEKEESRPSAYEQRLSEWGLQDRPDARKVLEYIKRFDPDVFGAVPESGLWDGFHHRAFGLIAFLSLNIESARFEILPIWGLNFDGHPCGVDSKSIWQEIERELAPSAEKRIQMLIYSGPNFTSSQRSRLNWYIIDRVAAHFEIRLELFTAAQGLGVGSGDLHSRQPLPSSRNIFVLQSERGQSHLVAQVCGIPERPNESFVLVFLFGEFWDQADPKHAWPDMFRTSRIVQIDPSTQKASRFTIRRLKESAYNPRAADISSGKLAYWLSQLQDFGRDDVDLCLKRPLELLRPLIHCVLTDYNLSESLGVDFRNKQAAPDTTKSFGTTLERLKQNHESIITTYGGPLGLEPHRLIRDSKFVLELYERRKQDEANALAYSASIASLEESRLGIQQNQSVKRLTKLAFVFIPLSFVTSVFGMNIDLLIGSGPAWWTVVVAAAIAYVVVLIPLSVIARERISVVMRDGLGRTTTKYREEV